MKNKNFLVIFLFPVVILMTMVSTYYWPEREASREIASIFDWFGFKGTLRNAATVEVETAEAHVLLDNNSAFESKLELIRSAKKSIRMSYFIYSSDHSSSLMTKELIAAAKRGVKVKLILDYHANYKKLDFYKMIEREGAPNIDIRLYNRPTKNIVRDALFLTTPCPGMNFEDKACHKYKNKVVEKILKTSKHDRSSKNKNKISNAHTKYSQMFLAGLYAKDPKLIAKAVVEGQQLDLEELMASGDTSEEDKAALKELASLYYTSKFGDPLEVIRSKIKLAAAFIIYNDEIMPVVNTLAALLPTKTRNDRDHMKDIEYLTDFTHHKILLVDDRGIQLGGRNIENSYHMDQNPLTAKYTFMDTDVRLDFTDGGEDMVRAFDEIFNYTRLLATLEEVGMHAPNDYPMNKDVLNAASKKCEGYLKIKNSVKYTQCFDWAYERSMVSEDKRIAKHKSSMDEKAAKFQRSYKIPELDGEFSSTIKRNFVIRPSSETIIAYLENLHLNRKEMTDPTRVESQRVLPVKPKDRTKTYGSRNSRDLSYGKNINYAIKKSFKEVCEEAQKGGEKRVIVHNAYFLPPAGVYAEFAKMVDGTYNCAGVKVQMLTNSMKTTDLSMMNIFSKYGLTTFLRFVKERTNKRSATFEYYEYKPLSKDPTKNMSLHSKVFILGNHAFIGSLNIDPRSYLMDTNNGFYFYQVPEFTRSYVENFDRILANPNFVENRTKLFREASVEGYAESDVSMLKAVLSEKGGDYVQKIPAEWREKGEKFIKKQLIGIAEKTRRVLEKKKSSDQDKLDHLLELI